MEGEPEFEVTRGTAAGMVVVTPRGESELATAGEVYAVTEHARAEANQVYLDLREVTFIDSAGVRLVVESARTLQAQGGELVVVRGGPEVRRIFDLVGLDGHVRVVDALPGE